MKNKHPITAEDAELDMVFEGFESLPPFNVAEMVENLIEDFGDGAANHAQLMIRLARSFNKPEIAEDYELVRQIILKQQGKD